MITSRFELEIGILQDQQVHNNCCLRSFILFKMKFDKALWLGFFPPSRLQSTGAFLVMFLSNRYATFLAYLDTRSAEIGKTAIWILVRIDQVQFLSKLLPGFYSPRLQWRILFSWRVFLADFPNFSQYEGQTIHKKLNWLKNPYLEISFVNITLHFSNQENLVKVWNIFFTFIDAFFRFSSYLPQNIAV